MKVALLTLGCRVNQSESAVLEGSLKESGINIVDLNGKPDYCVVNTCTVTAKSDYNSRQAIRKAARSGAKVIVTGCYSQLWPDSSKRIPGVLEVVENSRKYEIVEIISKKPSSLFFGYSSRSRPFLKVQDGCNFKCSYCSVPLARDKSRSISLDSAVERVQLLESKGYKEVVLTGIHLGTYGHDLPDRTSLTRLIAEILIKTSIYRLRLSSLEINEIDDELIELLQDRRICRHLHLPLQSGSTRILALMRRNYTSDYFMKKIMQIYRRMENISIGTDIIVGFPSEKEVDFETSYQILKNMPFSYFHVFPFSPRPGTDASNMNNRPPQAVVKRRVHKIMELNREKKVRFLLSQLVNRHDIIVEEKLNGDMIAGTSSNYLKVAAPTDEYLKGSVAIVRPLRIVNDMIEGVIDKNP